MKFLKNPNGCSTSTPCADLVLRKEILPREFLVEEDAIKLEKAIQMVNEFLDQSIGNGYIHFIDKGRE